MNKQIPLFVLILGLLSAQAARAATVTLDYRYGSGGCYISAECTSDCQGLASLKFLVHGGSYAENVSPAEFTTRICEGDAWMSCDYWVESSMYEPGYYVGSFGPVDIVHCQDSAMYLSPYVDEWYPELAGEFMVWSGGEKVPADLNCLVPVFIPEPATLSLLAFPAVLLPSRKRRRLPDTPA